MNHHSNLRSLVRQFGSNGNFFKSHWNFYNGYAGYGGWTGYGSVYYRVPIIDGFSTNSPLPTDSIEITDVFNNLAKKIKWLKKLKK